MASLKTAFPMKIMYWCLFRLISKKNILKNIYDLGSKVEKELWVICNYYSFLAIRILKKKKKVIFVTRGKL